MRVTAVLSACVTVGLFACTSENAPTQPDAEGDLVPVTPSLASARNTWTPKAPPPFLGDPTGSAFFGFDLGMAPNSAGQSIVYTFGGTDGAGGSGFGILAYNVATNSWTWRVSDVSAFYTHGIGKIGNRLYFSGGWDYGVGFKAPLKAVYAYDYAHDRLIRKADLPKFGAEGVSGVIDGKLYVLPGACAGDLWPNPEYCEQEPTRRFYRYNPATNSWQTRASSPHFHRQGAAAVLNGKLYVVGGSKGIAGEEPVADLDVYDPATNSWRTLAPLPTGGHAFGAALGGRLYVVVGGAVIRFYAYDPATNKWTAKAAPDFLGPVVRVALEGRSYLFSVSGDRSALYTP